MGIAVRPDSHVIDGITPRDIVRATNEAEVVDAIRGANERGEAIVVSGGATRLGVGDPPARYDVAVDVSALHGIVEYEPGDLVATVRAGTTLAELAESLTPRKQRWPVEPGLPQRATVGGTLASAAGGPSRLRYFHPRDWVIGARVVLGDGTPVRSGGRVVKNVTGYDLTRLWSGTFGTLVAIVELTLKLTAIPERTVSLVAEVDVPAAFEAANALHASGLPLDALAIVTGEAVGTIGARGDAALLVRLTGPAAAVRRLGREIRDRIRCRDVPNDAWDRVAALPLEAKWTARVAWPAATRPAIQFAGYPAVIYPANSTAYLLRSIDRATFGKVRASLETAGGIAVLERATAEYKRDAGGAWGAPRVPLGIARALKDRFDPRGVLSPGRVPV
ncbi:MAG TPA: FAD-binding protein [Candidatus Polarisedimenticolia bacterium]|nr:FAD-binding protein [Candidatus Polarisedimenticolia bacterium]